MFLDAGRKGVAHARPDLVDAALDAFLHDVADIVDDVCVVADSAFHGVGPAQPIEEIVAAVAHEHVAGGVSVKPVVQVVAAAIDRAGTLLQKQSLDVVAELVIRGRTNRVVAFGGILDHDVQTVVDVIGVVANSACHGVIADAAVDDVVAAEAEDRVVAAQALYPVITAGAVERLRSAGACNVCHCVLHSMGAAGTHRGGRI
jgi:hypothetical protein